MDTTSPQVNNSDYVVWEQKMGSPNYRGLSIDEQNALTKEKVDTIKGQLVGFTQWQARHILECVVENLEEQRIEFLNQITVF